MIANQYDLQVLISFWGGNMSQPLTLSKLALQPLTPCRRGDLPLDDVEVQSYLSTMNLWRLYRQDQVGTGDDDGLSDYVGFDGVDKIQAAFKFRDYLQGVKFLGWVAEAAEAEDHHPLIILQWRSVSVFWWTHTINGLHRNDFIMAARSEEIYHRMMNE